MTLLSDRILERNSNPVFLANFFFFLMLLLDWAIVEDDAMACSATKHHLLLLQLARTIDPFTIMWVKMLVAGR